MAIDPANHRAYAFGDFRVDSVDRVLLRDGERVALTPKVIDLLLLLLENHGHVVGKDRLMKEVWPDTFVEEGNLTQNISVLRRALSNGGQQYIQTVPRRGYRFVGQVREIGEAVIIEEHSLTRVVVEETQTEAQRSHQPVPTVESSLAMNPLSFTHSRWRRMALIFAGLLLMVTAVAVGWTIRGSRTGASHNPPPFDVNNVTLRTITSVGNVVYGVISPDGQFVVYSTLDEDNRFALWLRRTASKEVLQLIPPTTRSTGPAAISHDGNWIYYGEANTDEPLKGFTIYRMPLFGGVARKIVEGVHVFAALSPDDQRILLHRFKDTGGMDVISVNALDGSDERLIASGKSTSDYMGTQWSPDGRRLLFFSSEQRPDGSYWSLSEMPAEGGAHRTILPASQRKMSFIAWADDGRGIVMNAIDPVSRTAQLFYVSYPDGAIHRITNDLVGYTTVSVGGETIMAGKVERQSKVWVTDWPALGPARPAIERNMADGLAWLPDHKMIYDTNDDGRIHLWMADSAGLQYQQLSPDSTDERQPDVSPDGKLIAFLSRRSGSVALWVMDADGRNSRRLTEDGVQPWRPRFAPDGQTIFFLMERNARTFLARISVSGGEPSVIADDVNSESYFDISPDGRRLAYSVKDNSRHTTRVVVRSVTGPPVSYLDIEPGYFLRWTPDGQNLAYAQAPEDKKQGAALWLQPVDGGRPRQVLSVAPDLLYWAAWSPDGKQLAVSHGRFVRDIVLLSRDSTSGQRSAPEVARASNR